MISIQPFSGLLQQLKLLGVIFCGIAHELRKGQAFRIGRYAGLIGNIQTHGFDQREPFGPLKGPRCFFQSQMMRGKGGLCARPQLQPILKQPVTWMLNQI